MNAQPDRRLHAYRPDLAEEALRGSVTAGHYVTGTPARLSASVASLRPRPDETAGIDTAEHAETAYDLVSRGGRVGVSGSGPIHDARHHTESLSPEGAK